MREFKPKFIFKKMNDTNNQFDTSQIVFASDAECLPEILTDFESFLRSAGYSLSGTLDFVEDDLPERDEE